MRGIYLEFPTRHIKDICIHASFKGKKYDEEQMDVKLIGNNNDTTIVRLREFDKLMATSKDSLDSLFNIKILTDKWIIHPI